MSSVSPGTTGNETKSRGGDVDLAPVQDLGDRIPSGTTRYAYLRAVIRSVIENGTWSTGDKLPNEESLASLTGLSLGTVQRALGELASAGYITRRQGRGTFVASRSLELDEPLHCRFVREGEEGYVPVFTKLLSRGLRKDAGPFADMLGHADEFVCLERLIDIDHEFSVHSLLLFAYPQYAALLDIPADAFNTSNIKTILFQELDVSVRRIVQRLRIWPVAPDVAGLIGAEAGSPGIQMRTAAFSEEEPVIYGQELSFPATERWLVVNNMSAI